MKIAQDGGNFNFRSRLSVEIGRGNDCPKLMKTFKCRTHY